MEGMWKIKEACRGVLCGGSKVDGFEGEWKVYEENGESLVEGGKLSSLGKGRKLKGWGNKCLRKMTKFRERVNSAGI